MVCFFQVSYKPTTCSLAISFQLVGSRSDTVGFVELQNKNGGRTKNERSSFFFPGGTWRNSSLWNLLLLKMEVSPALPAQFVED